MRPTQGVALGGRYRLDRRIAVGGMGEVWVGHDLSLGRDVAVKVLREEFAGDAGFLARFRTEARNAASLSHPNIAALFDYGEQGGSSYLVMELVSGPNLRQRLADGPLAPLEIAQLGYDLAEGLEYMHAAGVVHRDVKPANILLGEDGEARLCDFGSACRIGERSYIGMGTQIKEGVTIGDEVIVGMGSVVYNDIPNGMIALGNPARPMRPNVDKLVFKKH